MKEGIVQQWVKQQLLKVYGERVYMFKVPQGPYSSRRGVPDLVCSIDGQFVAIEVKTEVGKLTALQQLEIDKIIKAGGKAFAIFGRDEKQITALIDYIDRG